MRVLTGRLAFSWKVAIPLLGAAIISTLAAWWWGSRFQEESTSLSSSSLVSRYIVEGVRADVYDSPPPVTTTESSQEGGAVPGQMRQLHIDAERLEALDEPGKRWALTAPVFTGKEADGRTIQIKAPTAIWDSERQEAYLPEAVEATLQQPEQPIATLRTRQVTWDAKKRIILTDQPLVLKYGEQQLDAVGLRWELLTGQVQLKSRVRWQGNGKV